MYNKLPSLKLVTAFILFTLIEFICYEPLLTSISKGVMKLKVTRILLYLFVLFNILGLLCWITLMFIDIFN